MGDGNKTSSSTVSHLYQAFEHILTVMTGVWAGWLMWDHTSPRSVDLRGNRLESVGIAWFITLRGLKGDRWKHFISHLWQKALAIMFLKALWCTSALLRWRGWELALKQGCLKDSISNAQNKYEWISKTIQNQDPGDEAQKSVLPSF